MLIITSIKKNKNSYDIYINEKFSFEITESEYLKIGLYEKTQLTDEEYRNILDTAIFSRAKKIALNYIAFKMRTSEEVSRKLVLGKINPDVIDKTLVYFKSLGYINDEDFAKKYIMDRIRLKPRSKKEINYELDNKGVSRSIIEEATNELMNDEFEVACTIFNKIFSNNDLYDNKVINKVYNYLSGRGFSEDIIKKTISFYKNINEV